MGVVGSGVVNARNARAIVNARQSIPARALPMPNQFNKCSRALNFVLKAKRKNRGKYHQFHHPFSLSFTYHKPHSDSLCARPNLATIALTYSHNQNAVQRNLAPLKAICCNPFTLFNPLFTRI